MRRERLDDWLRGHVLLVDTLWTGVALVTVLYAFGYYGQFVDVAEALALIGPLALRRTWPAVAFGAIAFASLVQWSFDVRLQLANAGLLLALYSVAAYGSRVWRWLALAIGLCGAFLALERFWLPNGDSKYVVTVGALLGFAVVGAFVAGDLRRTRLLVVAQLQERTAQLERERNQQSQLAASAERARIAREMHDVVAHGLSVVIVQAAGAEYVIDTNPAAAKRALATIAGTGREALTEMRTLLGLLRSGALLDGTTTAAGSSGPRSTSTTAAFDLTEDVATRSPQPGLDQIPALVEQLRSAGLDVELQLSGDEVPVPPSVGLTVYRVVQEGLTNALKHAGPGAHVIVTLTHHVDAVDVRVTDDGRGASAPSDGNGLGLVGMRERVAVAGGSVRAGPRVGGGYEVAAHVPRSLVGGRVS